LILSPTIWRAPTQTFSARSDETQNVETPRATLPTRIEPVELTLIGEQPDSIKYRSAAFFGDDGDGCDPWCDG
jgi:hypothetical protein